MYIYTKNVRTKLEGRNIMFELGIAIVEQLKNLNVRLQKYRNENDFWFSVEAAINELFKKLENNLYEYIDDIILLMETKMERASFQKVLTSRLNN